jgi:hypothetical protein
MFPRIPTGGVYREYGVPLQQKILLSLHIMAFFLPRTGWQVSIMRQRSGVSLFERPAVFCLS